MGHSFSAQKLKVNTKMSSHRLGLIQNKKKNALKVVRKEIAEQIHNDQIDHATIRVESLIREKDFIVAAEYMQQHVEKIFLRIAEIAANNQCPEDVFESIATVIYASDRMNISEFKAMLVQFSLKYSKRWVTPLTKQSRYSDARVVNLIGVESPSRTRIQEELISIANDFNVTFNPPPLETNAERRQSHVRNMSGEVSADNGINLISDDDEDEESRKRRKPKREKRVSEKDDYVCEEKSHSEDCFDDEEWRKLRKPKREKRVSEKDEYAVEEKSHSEEFFDDDDEDEEMRKRRKPKREKRVSEKDDYAFEEKSHSTHIVADDDDDDDELPKTAKKKGDNADDDDDDDDDLAARFAALKKL